MNKGIVLIAAGHPYYGSYAYQLAVSIKDTAPDIPISIIIEGRGISHLQGFKLAIFDQIIEAPKETFTTKSGSRDVFKIKTCLYDLTPYKETLYFDADMLWLPRKSVNDLFEEMKDIDFTMSNRGSVSISEANTGFIMWANPAEIKTAYGLSNERLFNLSSEFIYFKKNKDVKKLFDKTKKNFDFPKVQFQIFGNSQPDELSFIIAMMQTGIYPHKDPFFPAYWEQFQHQNLSNREMYQGYYLCSFGGAFNEPRVHNFYNELSKYYLNKIGGELFPLQNKNKFLTNRHI